MTKNKDEKSIIEEISYLHDELDSNRTPLVIKQVIELSPSEHSCAIKCIIQPILDNKLPCDNNSFSKQDHENILKCFYTFFTSNENNEGISDYNRVTSNLLNMKINNTERIDDDTLITKVLNGWIYKHEVYLRGDVISISTTFVPHYTYTHVVRN